MIVTACAVLDFDGRMLLGRRTDNNLYGPPGGKLDQGESLKQGCVREVLEEAGLRVEKHDLVELGFCEYKDQIIFWYWASLYKGHPRNLEPHKCHGWGFLDIPPGEECLPGLRLFKAKLLGVLANVSGIQPRRAA